MKGLRIALGFLSVLPVRAETAFHPGDLGRSAAWFPLVGLVIGLLLAAARLGLALLLPDPLGAALVLAVWVALTGGLHLDGLADCCDGLLASVPVERRLEILKDPRLGSFGGIGLILALLVKLLALAASGPVGGAALVSPRLPSGALLSLPAPWAGLLPLIVAPVIGRWLILLLARQPMARPGGLGAEFALGVTRSTYAVAGLVTLLVLALGVVLGGWRCLLALALAHLAALGAVRLARARLGGLTGDVIGLVVELGEIASLLGFAVLL